ncbi:MAG: PD40 domain-containing protein [Holophagales bacterium]|nr:PD40 domain-containing protein [Holophagales bacterium]
MEARGEILSVPAEKGDARNLTRSPGVADRDPSFSPDGKSVAWLSDASGEYALHLGMPDGMGPVRKVDLGLPPSFFYAPRWSPDSKRIALTDKRMNLWAVDVVKDEGEGRLRPLRYALSNLDPAWAPDARWIAYVKQLPNRLHAVLSTAGGEEDATGDRWAERRSVAPVRPGREVPLLRREHRRRPLPGWLDMTSMGGR